MVEKPKAKKRRKKRSFFPLIYISFVLILVLCSAFALMTLKDVLIDYESSMAIYVAEDYAKLANDNTTAFLKSNLGLKPSEFEDEKVLDEYVNNITQNKPLIFGKKFGEYTKAKPTYILAIDDKEIATFSLKNKAEKSKFGFDLWELGDVSFMSYTTQAYTISSLSTVTVSVNGKVLSDAYIKEKGIAIDFPTARVEGFEKPTKTTYQIINLFQKPEITAVEQNGNPVEVIYDDVKKHFSISLVENNQIDKNLSDTAIDILKHYSLYLIGEDDFSSFSAYLDKDMPTYDAIRKMQTQYFGDHNGIVIENERTWDIYHYGDNKVRLKVAMDQYAKRYNKIMRLDPAYDFFMTKKDGKWILSDLAITVLN